MFFWIFFGISMKHTCFSVFFLEFSEIDEKIRTFLENSKKIPKKHRVFVVFLQVCEDRFTRDPLAWDSFCQKTTKTRCFFGFFLEFSRKVHIFSSISENSRKNTEKHVCFTEIPKKIQKNIVFLPKIVQFGRPWDPGAHDPARLQSTTYQKTKSKPIILDDFWASSWWTPGSGF